MIIVRISYIYIYLIIKYLSLSLLMDGKIYISIVALICATTVVLYALSQGINGTVLTGFLAIICAAIGLPAGAVIQKKLQ